MEVSEYWNDALKFFDQERCSLCSLFCTDGKSRGATVGRNFRKMELERHDNLNPSVRPTKAPRLALGGYRFASDFEGTDMHFVKEMWPAPYTDDDANPDGKP